MKVAMGYTKYHKEKLDTIWGTKKKNSSIYFQSLKKKIDFLSFGGKKTFSELKKSIFRLKKPQGSHQIKHLD